jgi:hypothetical protein
MQFTKKVGRPASKTPAVPKALTHAAIVQQRVERWRKDRAAAQPLRAAFPAVTQLQVELRFQGSTSPPPASQLHQLFPPAAAFFEFRCPHADCDGQFDLSAAVDAAISSSSRSARGTLCCEGHRGRSLASSEQQSCGLRVDYAVTAECRRVA